MGLEENTLNIFSRCHLTQDRYITVPSFKHKERQFLQNTCQKWPEKGLPNTPLYPAPLSTYQSSSQNKSMHFQKIVRFQIFKLTYLFLTCDILLFFSQPIRQHAIKESRRAEEQCRLWTCQEEP